MPKNSQFTPPALPPKKQRIDSSNASLNSMNSPPMSPKISNDSVFPLNQSEEKDENTETQSKTREKENFQDCEKHESVEPSTVVLRKKPTEMVNKIRCHLNYLKHNTFQMKTSSLMEEINIDEYLVYKKDGEDGQKILIGGRPEALIINATKVQKISEGRCCQFQLSHVANMHSFLCKISIWRSISSYFPNVYKPRRTY